MTVNYYIDKLFLTVLYNNNNNNNNNNKLCTDDRHLIVVSASILITRVRSSLRSCD